MRAATSSRAWWRRSKDPDLRRAAFVLASTSVALSILGTARAVVVFRNDQPGVLVWVGVPLAFATAGMLSTLTPWVEPIWVCAGALCGFVILGAWSLGTFYAYGALVMLVGAAVHFTGVRGRWKALLVPLWIAAGAGLVSAFFFVRDLLENREYRYVSHAPAVVWGTWMFVGASAAWLAAYGLLGLTGGRRV